MPKNSSAKHKDKWLLVNQTNYSAQLCSYEEWKISFYESLTKLNHIVRHLSHPECLEFHMYTQAPPNPSPTNLVHLYKSSDNCCLITVSAS